MDQASIDPTAVAAVIVGAVTVIGSVFIAAFNARRARERVAVEANRAKKAEAYHAFMGILVNVMKSVKSGEAPKEQELTQIFTNFAAAAMIYGGPDVVRAFHKWRAAADDPKAALRLMDGMLRAMRADLGESNRGIAEYGLIGLFVVGGPAALKKSLSSM